MSSRASSRAADRGRNRPFAPPEGAIIPLIRYPSRPGAEALLLDEVDLEQPLSRAEYQRVFPDLQERLRRLQYALLDAEIPTVVVFEGWDAAGKGTVIQRLTERLDPRAFRVHPGAPPSELEQRYHFLWRHQMRLPEDGHMVALRPLLVRPRPRGAGREAGSKREAGVQAYDADQRVRALARRRRPGAGEVLVPHLEEGAAPPARRRWRRTRAERWKVEKEDWRRNRRYGRWLEAVEEMLARTDTAGLPVDGGGGHRPALDAGRRSSSTLVDADGGRAGPAAAGARAR